MAPKRRKPFDPKAFLAQVGEGHSTGKYRKGQVVFSQGDTGDAVFYVQKGKVKITVSRSKARKLSSHC
jgi:CRP/FNR family cyclic AMP-dependent transcriptional regulator